MLRPGLNLNGLNGIEVKAGRRPIAVTVRSARPGFTLVDVLVSLTVVAVLIGLMLPAIVGVRSSARRVACSSQLRQHGLCSQLYSDDHNGMLVGSLFTNARFTTTYNPQESNTLRLADGRWDGLGLLHAAGYMDAPAVYYCPAHPGDLQYEVYSPKFAGEPGEILAPYHYRGSGSDGLSKRYMLPPNRAMVSDILVAGDLANHDGGTNVLRADASVGWIEDQAGVLASAQKGTALPAEVDDKWTLLDKSRRTIGDRSTSDSTESQHGASRN